MVNEFAEQLVETNFIDLSHIMIESNSSNKESNDSNRRSNQN